MKAVTGALLSAAVALAAAIVWTWASTPIVQYSHADGSCVAVIPETAGDCGNKPTRYTTEVVK